MIIVSIHGGLVSQIRAFYIGYKLGRKFEDAVVLELSNYYNGYYRPYILDFFDVPDDMRIVARGGFHDRLKQLESICGQEVQTIKNGDELDRLYHHFDPKKAYYLVNDCCCYDDFCRKHQEFFYRYIGNDLLTKEIMDMMQMQCASKYIQNFDKQIENKESVGIHIRLQDFIQVGWIVEEDYDFYRAAVQWYRIKLKKPFFIVFSDDMETAKKILGVSSDLYYMENIGDDKNDVEQLLCLSKCKHRVLSKKSGFSLFAATIAQNKWKLQGYSLIIEQMNLANDANEKEYVDINFNQTPICRWEDNLCNCVQLDKREILELNKRYLEYQNCYMRTESIWSRPDKAKDEKPVFIFATLQTFSKTVITGMERMAKWLAEEKHEVHFIGEKNPFNGNENEGFSWTIQNAHQAEDFNGNFLGYMLYPYEELNINDNYLEFIRYICQGKENKEACVIVRKSQALPLLEQHKHYNIKFIFIDFTDSFERENWEKLSDTELGYLYTNADVVITFDDSVFERYENLSHKIVYIDIKTIYPDMKIWVKKIRNLDEINACEDILYRHIYHAIRGA